MDKLFSSALGDIPFDLALKNARYVNVFTGEIYPAEIGVASGRIAHVTQPGESGLDGREVFDCGGRHVVPGLIDTHVHIESGMMTPANFARAVVPHGTTTVLADPHEIANVMGVDGIEFCLKAAEGIVLRVYWAAPSCVPSVVGLETNRMAFNAPEIARMLDMPGVHTLGEVMDYMGVVRCDPRMLAILEEARKRGKLIQGHVIDVTSRQLSVYQAAGVESDHESRTLEDVLMKLRAGMTVECRHGSTAQNVRMEAEALRMTGYPVNATLCTDDREVDDLLRLGHMDEAVRQAIAAGVPPIEAVRLATRNAALFLGLKDVGALRPGSRADIVLLDDLEDFRVGTVFVGGVLAADAGLFKIDFADPDFGPAARDTMNVKGELRREDFLIPADGPTVRLNGMSFRNGDPFHTTLARADFPVRGGAADIGALADFVTMAVVERHNATGNIAVAPAENIGLRHGAVAGTVAHDSHNLFVFGKDPDDMLVAARRLVELGGGFAAVVGGRVVAEVALPVCGLMSLKSAPDLAADMAGLKRAVNEMGIVADSPVHVLTWFSLAVLPEVRLTDKGLVDTIGQKIIPVRA